MNEALNSPEMAAAVEDAKRFLDMERTGMILVQEKILAGLSALTPTTGGYIGVIGRLDDHADGHLAHLFGPGRPRRRGRHHAHRPARHATLSSPSWPGQRTQHTDQP